MSEEKERESDIRELSQVLDAVSKFIRDLREPIEQLLQSFQKNISGSAIGEDVVNFYNKLISSGMPKDVVEQMTKEYFKMRMEQGNIFRLLEKLLEEKGSEAGKSFAGIVVKGKEEKQ